MTSISYRLDIALAAPKKSFDFLDGRKKRGVDKTWNMEHPGTFRNIPEHSGTSNNYKNYEKKM